MDNVPAHEEFGISSPDQLPTPSPPRSHLGWGGLILDPALLEADTIESLHELGFSEVEKSPSGSFIRVMREAGVLGQRSEMAALPGTPPPLHPLLFLLQRRVWTCISLLVYVEEAPSSSSSWCYSFSTSTRGKNRTVGGMVSPPPRPPPPHFCPPTPPPHFCPPAAPRQNPHGNNSWGRHSESGKKIMEMGSLRMSGLSPAVTVCSISWLA